MQDIVNIRSLSQTTSNPYPTAAPLTGIDAMGTTNVICLNVDNILPVVFLAATVVGFCGYAIYRIFRPKKGSDVRLRHTEEEEGYAKGRDEMVEI